MPNRGVHQSGSAYRSAINYRVHFHVILPRVLMRPVCDRILTPWCRIINHNCGRDGDAGWDGAVNMNSLCLPPVDDGYLGALRKYSNLVLISKRTVSLNFPHNNLIRQLNICNFCSWHAYHSYAALAIIYWLMKWPMNNAKTDCLASSSLTILKMYKIFLKECTNLVLLQVFFNSAWFSAWMEQKSNEFP